jgi:hypothetical protein
LRVHRLTTLVAVTLLAWQVGAQTIAAPEKLKAIVAERYPQLARQSVDGTAIVTLLFDAQGQVIASRLRVSSTSAVTASAVEFADLGVSAGQLKSMGTEHIDFAVNRVWVVFASRGPMGDLGPLE